MIKFALEPLSYPEQELHDRALQEAKRYLESEARLFKIIDEVDLSRFYLKLGYSSTFEYCLKALRLTEAVILNFINVARKAREIPELATAIEKGELRVATARKIVPVLDQDSAQEWISLAKKVPQAQLERAIANAIGRHTVERASPAGGNRTQLQVGFDEATMRDLKWVQDFVSQKVGHCVGFEEAIATTVESYRNQHDPVRKAQRNHEKSANVDRTADSPVKSAGSMQTGPSTSTLHMSQTGAGASARPRPAAVYHEVNLRDGRTCQAILPSSQRCGRTRFLHYHHRLAVELGGPTTAKNLITLCSQCHSRWHDQESVLRSRVNLYRVSG